MTSTVSATEFNRTPSKVLRSAEKGVRVDVEKHGRITAILEPQPEITSGADLARRLDSTRPDPRTAADLKRLIKSLNEAD